MKQQKNQTSFTTKGILKSVFLLLVLSLLTNTIQAQIFVTCTHRDYYKYNEETKEFEYSNGYDENSMFKINSKITMFEHITPNMSSTYYVNESDFDEENKKLTLDVVSDVGNEYKYIFDFAEESVTVAITNDGELIGLVFTVKKIWNKSEDNE